MDSLIPIDSILEPISDEFPCGDADPSRGKTSYAATEALADALCKLAKVKSARLGRNPEGQVFVEAPEQEPDWHLLRTVALDLFLEKETTDITVPVSPNGETSNRKLEFRRVKHLRVAVILAMASLAIDGLRGYAEGLMLIEKLLTVFGDQVHPQPNRDPESGDPEDPYFKRIQALSLLTGPSTTSPVDDPYRVARRLLSSTLLVFGDDRSLSIQECIGPWANAFPKLNLPSGSAAPTDVINEARLRRHQEIPGIEGILDRAIASAAAIEEAVRNQAVEPMKVDMTETIAILTAARTVLNKARADELLGLSQSNPLPNQATMDSGNKSQAGTTVGLGIANPTTAPSGPLANRESALFALTQAADYFRKYEPSSPIPLMIDYAKRLAGLDFMKLLEELRLHSDALTQFKVVAGIRDSESKE